MKNNQMESNDTLDQAVTDLKREQEALGAAAPVDKPVDDSAVVASGARARKATKKAQDARAEAARIAEREKAQALSEQEKEKEKEKAQAAREKEKAKEKAKAAREKEKAKEKAKAAREKEKAKEKAKAAREKEKEKEKAKALREKEKEKAKAIQAKEKAKPSPSKVASAPEKTETPASFDFAKARKDTERADAPRDARQIVEDKLAARRALESNEPTVQDDDTIFGKRVSAEASKDLSRLEEENARLSRELKDSQEKAQDARERQTATQLNEDALKTRLASERERAKQNAEKAKDAISALSLLKKEHADLTARSAHLEAIATGYDAAIAASDQEKAALSEHVASLNDQLSLERAANGGNREEFQKAMDEINARIAAKLASVDQASAQESNEVKRLKAEAAALSKRIQELESQDRDLSEAKDNALAATNEQLLLENQHYAEVIASLQSASAQQSAELNATKDENDRMKKTIAESSDSASSLQQTLADTLEKYENERKEKDALAQENKDHAQALQAANDDLIKKNRDLASLTLENGRLADSLKNRDTDYEATKKENEALTADKDKVLVDLLGAQVALKSANEQVAQVDAMKASYEATIAARDADIAKAKASIESLERQTNDLSATVDDQLNQLATATQTEKENAERIASLEEDIKSQGEAYQAWKAEATTLSTAKTTEDAQSAGALQEEITRLTQEKASLEEQLAKASAEKPAYDAGRSYLVSDSAIPLEIREGYGVYAADYVDKKRYLAIIANLQSENDALKMIPSAGALEEQVRALKKENEDLKASATDVALVEKLEAENRMLREAVAASLPKEEAHLATATEPVDLSEAIAACRKEITAKDAEVNAIANKIVSDTRAAQIADPVYQKRIAVLAQQENVTMSRIAAQEAENDKVLAAAVQRKKGYEDRLQELTNQLDALKKDYQDRHDASSSARDEYEKAHLPLSYQLDDVKQRLALAVTDLERAQSRHDAFAASKTADIRALQARRKEIVDSAADSVEANQDIAQAKAQHKTLLKEKLALQEKLNGLLAQEKAEASRVALAAAEESIDLAAYRSASGADAKLRELTRQYIVQADQEKAVMVELKKRQAFVNEMRARVPQVRDHVVLTNQLASLDKSQDAARVTLVQTKLASLKTTREVQVYLKLVDQVARLTEADREQIQRLSHLRSCIDALKAERAAKATQTIA